MKKLYKSKKYKRYNLRKSRRANKRRHKRSRQKQNRKRKANDINLKRNRINFCENLFLESKDEKIFKYINTIETFENPVLDFSKVKMIDVGSALYIKAYCDYLKSNKKNFKICCSPKNQKMRQILQHLEIYNYNLKITHKDISCWVLKTWDFEHKEKYGKVMMEEVLPHVLEGKIPSEEFSKIAVNLNELLANCSEHAYTDEYPFKNYYLIAGEYASEYKYSNKFSFCILDVGQGFRKSISNYGIFNTFLDNIRIQPKPDSTILQKTVEGKFNANRDKKSGRGAGLSEVAKSVKSIKGCLYLYSDKGCFSIVDGNNEYLNERENSVKGSIVEIILPINNTESY